MVQKYKDPGQLIATNWREGKESEIYLAKKGQELGQIKTRGAWTFKPTNAWWGGKKKQKKQCT